LLRTIVATIDRYGLKKRHLNKHLESVPHGGGCIDKRLIRWPINFGKTAVTLVCHTERPFSYRTVS
jgi:hypothetical protein